MSQKVSLKENFIYNILYEIFRIILPLLTAPYISRVLGSEGIGTYTLAHTYSQYFVLIAGFGFSTYAARELAYKRNNKSEFRQTFWEIFIARSAMNIVATTVYILYFFLFIDLKDPSYRICVLYLIASWFDFSYYFKAIENFKTIAVRNIIIKIFSIVLIFAFVREKSDVWIYTLILALSELCGQSIMIISLDKSLFLKTDIRMKNLSNHFAMSFTLFIPTLAIQIYTMLDKVMLGYMCNESEVGYYENAQKMVRLAAAVAASIVSVMTPRVANLYSCGDIKGIKEKFYKTFSFVSFLVFPMCFGLIGVSKNFSTWYYGKNFIGIDVLVSTGAILIVSLGWSGILGNMLLIATNNQKYYTVAVYISALVNVIFNLTLIPLMRAEGAIIASVIAEVSGMAIMFFCCDKLFHIKTALKNVFKYLWASVFMGGIMLWISFFVKMSIGGTTILIMVGCIIYFLLMMLSKDPNLTECLCSIKKLLDRNDNIKK